MFFTFIGLIGCCNNINLSDKGTKVRTELWCNLQVIALQFYDDAICKKLLVSHVIFSNLSENCIPLVLSKIGNLAVLMHFGFSHNNKYSRSASASSSEITFWFFMTGNWSRWFKWILNALCMKTTNLARKQNRRGIFWYRFLTPTVFSNSHRFRVI